MKVLMLQGSARKEGNTAQMLTWMEEACQELGHEVEQVGLAYKEIKGCLGCAACKKSVDTIACIQKDDAEEVLQKMIDADLILFASPAYFWGFTSQMKALMDRSWSLVTGFHTPEHASLVDGKKMALLVTGGGQYENNVDPMFAAFGRLNAFYKSENVGELFIGKCAMDGTLPEDSQEQVLALAQEMLS